MFIIAPHLSGSSAKLFDCFFGVGPQVVVAVLVLVLVLVLVFMLVLALVWRVAAVLA